MSGGQIAALIFAILLLLPGGCFLIMGIGMTFDTQRDAIEQDLGPLGLIVGTGLLSLTALLFWLALRRRRGAPQSTDVPPAV